MGMGVTKSSPVMHPDMSAGEFSRAWWASEFGLESVLTDARYAAEQLVIASKGGMINTMDCISRAHDAMDRIVERLETCLRGQMTSADVETEQELIDVAER